jgi:L-alanine-DL-glutamate epimerase-like enolase superfamily enzyme
VTKRTLAVAQEAWPLAAAFTSSRGTKTQADVVTVTLTDGTATGRGECVPYPRYGESPESVTDQIEGCRAALEGGANRRDVQDLLPAGAARNAVDCALWDLEAKTAGQPAWRLAGLDEPAPLVTAYTLSLGTPEAMAAAARENAGRPLLKIKLGGDGDEDRIRAVRQAAPDARLIVDANEAWTPDMLAPFLKAMAELDVALVEQPLPAGDDAALADVARPVPVCADESAHDRAGLDALAGRYDVINIKLDKTGGLTEALALARAARDRGFGVMVGCMVGTSLAMAPAMLVGGLADFVDLDGPLLLAKDREPGIAFSGSTMLPAPQALWG